MRICNACAWEWRAGIEGSLESWASQSVCLKQISRFSENACLKTQGKGVTEDGMLAFASLNSICTLAGKHTGTHAFTQVYTTNAHMAKFCSSPVPQNVDYVEQKSHRRQGFVIGN